VLKAFSQEDFPEGSDMRGLVILCFLLALPPLAVLGHDVYLAYYGPDMKPDHAIQLSDVGWLLKTYTPDAHQWLVDNTDKDVWDKYVGPLLEQTALFVALPPFLLAAFITLVIKLVNWRPAGGGKFKGKKSGIAFGEEKGGKTKYKRK
jgi:hypothetical protein